MIWTRLGAPTNFCSLIHTGGVAPVEYEDLDIGAPLRLDGTSGMAIRWYSIYSNYMPWSTRDPETEGRNPVVPLVDGAYYMEYPNVGDEHDAWDNPHVTYVDTVDDWGLCRVSFYAPGDGRRYRRLPVEPEPNLRGPRV